MADLRSARFIVLNSGLILVLAVLLSLTAVAQQTKWTAEDAAHANDAAGGSGWQRLGRHAGGAGR